MGTSVVKHTGGGPDRVWSSLKSKAVKRRTGKKVLDLEPLDSTYTDIESFFNVLTDHSIPQEVVKDAFPDHHLALSWYTSIQPSSQRWYLEALLLTSLPLKEIAYLIDPSGPVLAVDVYKRAFFNVTPDRKANPGWMHQYVWGPAMGKNTRLYLYDFVFKLAGFFAGEEMINQLVNPAVLSRSAVDWLKGVAQDQRLRFTLTFGGTYGKLPSELQVAVTETAIKTWEDSGKAQNNSGLTSETVDKLVDAVQDSIGIIKRDEAQPSKYQFVSPMYDDPPVDKEDKNER